MIRFFHMSDSRALRLLVNLAIVGILVEIPFTVVAVRDLNHQAQQLHNSNIATLQTIQANQVKDALAVKTYIACLLTLNPQASQNTVQLQEAVCFNKAPQVTP